MIDTKDFGIIVTGLLMASGLTKKAQKPILSIAVGDSMVKVICEENGLALGSVYRAKVSSGGDGLYFERERLMKPPVSPVK